MGNNTGYSGEGYKGEFIIRDNNFVKLDTFKFNLKDFGKFFSILKRKYGLSFKQNNYDSIKEEVEEQKGIDWFGEAKW